MKQLVVIIFLITSFSLSAEKKDYDEKTLIELCEKYYEEAQTTNV